MKLAIVGSRDYHNYSFFRSQVESFLEGRTPTLIISGGASGADEMAERYAIEMKVELQVFEADWAKYGKGAGPKRNMQIVEAATHVIAFPTTKSIGTFDTIRKAQKAGKPIHVVHV